MFRSLIRDAKTAAGAVVSKYVIRASVAVPFVVAAGFGTAAVTLILVERFGAVAAYGLMAGGFVAIGLVSALLVTIKEQEEKAEDKKAADADTAEVASDTATQAAIQLPMALVGTLLTSPFGPSAALSGAKLLVRNLPLVILLLVIGYLLWPGENQEPAEAEAQPSDPDPLPPEHAGSQPSVQPGQFDRAA